MARLNDRLSAPPPAAGDPDVVRHHRHQLRGGAVRARRPGGADDRGTARPWRHVRPVSAPPHRMSARPGAYRGAQRARPACRRRHQEDVRLRQAAADTLSSTWSAATCASTSAAASSATRPVLHLIAAEDAGLDLARSVVDAAGLSRSPSRSASPRRCATAAASTSRAAPSCWSATRCRASCSPSCSSCCSPAAAIVHWFPLRGLHQRRVRGLELSGPLRATTSGTWCCRPSPSWPAASPA